METKYCKDCKYLFNEICCRPMGKKNLVTGRERICGNFALTERETNHADAIVFDCCGEDARYFEPK